MSWWSTARAVGGALGIWERRAEPLGCAFGRAIYREAKRSSQIVNVARRPRPLRPTTIGTLGPLFPALDLTTVRVRTRCRLPANRFDASGSTYAMTFGSTIYWRDELDEQRPDHIVRLLHELVHVDQVRRLGGERRFACEYGRGYIAGGGDVPDYLHDSSAYHHNPFEAEAFTFESKFRDESGRVDPSTIPNG